MKAMFRALSNSAKNILKVLGFLLILIAYSGYRAYRISDEDIKDKAPPPFFSIRFALHPNRHVEDAPELGFKPGWVVIFAPRFKTYGTAYFISPLGKMLAKGTPRIVTVQNQETQQQTQEYLEKFKRAFALLDSTIHVGMTFSNAARILRIEPFTRTNDDGTIDAYYTFLTDPRRIRKYDSLTNGITLHISNSIVIGKDRFTGSMSIGGG